MKNDVEKMTKTQLTKKILELNRKYRETLNSVYADPKVIETKKAYENALCKVREIVHKEAFKISEEIKVLNKELQKAKEEIHNAIPKDIQEFVSAIGQGIDFGPHGLVVKWISPKKTFVILTNPGHSFCSSMIDGWKYGATNHYLFSITKMSNYTFGWSMFQDKKISEHTGKMSKEILSQWKKYVENEEAKLS